jgi:Zn-finger nucleic acid-binding protein
MRASEFLTENLRDWFKEKWVRFGTDGKIRGACARGSEKEGKPKCLPQAKAHALGKKGRASAAARKRRQDPNAERRGAAINVKTKKVDEACWTGYKAVGLKKKSNRMVPNCVKEDETVAEQKIPFDQCPSCGGVIVHESELTEKQDACYHKVKSRYKVWPSAYASGALVQCRKKGAANWGNKSKNESRENNMDELSRIVELSTGLSLEARAELAEEFDLIESIIDNLAERNQVDAEAIWEDLESLSDDELYVFAVTSEPIMEDWQKVNKQDRTAGMSQKAVNAYRREHPGSKLKTAVTTKPSKLKRGSKASKRRKSYCSRSRGQMKMHNISCVKTPDKAICKARRRWNC